MKLCRKCNTEKSLDKFYKDSSKPDKHASNCKECKNKLHKKWASKNRDKCVKNSIKWASENKSKVSKQQSKWYLKNKERISLQSKEWKKSPKGRVYNRFYCSKRRAQKLNATLEGFDQEIKEIYKNCPEDYEVDHIMPLNNPTLCGLHVPWNLQYLTKEANKKKGNKILCVA